MIERTEIEGRAATVAYFTTEFAPTDADAAQLIKIIYDDGEIVFAVPTALPQARGTKVNQ